MTGIPPTWGVTGGKATKKPPVRGGYLSYLSYTCHIPVTHLKMTGIPPTWGMLKRRSEDLKDVETSIDVVRGNRVGERRRNHG